MNLLKAFHYHLETPGLGMYPLWSPCLFLENEGWTELCHLISNSKANRSVFKKLGNVELINMPLLNVVPGSRESNSGFRHGYSKDVRIIPKPVLVAAQETVSEFIKSLNGELDEGIAVILVRLLSYDEITTSELKLLQEKYEHAFIKALHPHKKLK